MKKKTVIFDLDGTLADIEVRRLISAKEDGSINFGIFFDPANIIHDHPNVPVIETFKSLRNSGYRMVIFSGRGMDMHKVTIDWLEKYDILPDLLKMRPNEKEPVHQLEFRFPGIAPKETDFRYTPDEVLKLKWLNEIFPGEERNNILCIFDDRQKVVDMWRREGLTCFQVAPGSF